MRRGCLEKLIIIPLFPQFSTATTSGIADIVFSKLLGWRNFRKKEKQYIPNIHFISNFYNHDNYKELYRAHIQKEIALLKKRPSTVVVSFHGLPRRYIQEGDVYQKHCEETFAYIQQAFSESNIIFLLTYQSRFGAEKWLSPTTEHTLQELAHKNQSEAVAIICPGFVTDCLETLSEIDKELRETYKCHGGHAQNFFYIPCLNTSSEFIHFLSESVQKSASGFIE